MALNNYRLRPPDRVILADNRDPYVSWQNHLARTGGLRGGIDLVAAMGTPVYARTAGRMIPMPNDGSAGNSSRFYHRDNAGWKDVFSHLSSYRTPKNPSGANAFDYEAGDIVAYTGNSGGVAPHLHWHLLDPNGNRQNPWNYFSEGGTAGGDRENIDNTPEPPKDEDIMIRIQSTNRGIALVGAGYYRGLTNDEEVQQSGPLISAHFTGNDRQFDLWVSMATSGYGATTYGDQALAARIADLATQVSEIESSPVTDAQLDALADKLIAKLAVPTSFSIVQGDA